MAKNKRRKPAVPPLRPEQKDKIRTTVQREVKRQEDRLRQALIDEYVSRIFILLIRALHDRNDWGPKRIARIISTMMLDLRCIGDGTITWDDVYKAVEECVDLEALDKMVDWGDEYEKITH